MKIKLLGAQSPHLFKIEQFYLALSWRDGAILTGIGILLYLGARLAFSTPENLVGPTVSLSPTLLPQYALLSLRRMLAAYFLSILFSLIYGQLAANSRRAAQYLIPLLDILQSIPILSFLPLVLLSLTAILPQGIATELASIILIFTSQVWNLAFAWYQSLTTQPEELREASTIFRFNGWLRFKVFHLPMAMLSLIWNSMMSWAGGWFFLMAAEIFTVGDRDFRLPGLGAYLQEAARQGNVQDIAWGLGTLIALIVALDQLIWRPLLAWGDRFKLEMVESDNPPQSWFYNWLRSSPRMEQLHHLLIHRPAEWLDNQIFHRFPLENQKAATSRRQRWLLGLIQLILGLALLYGLIQAGQMLIALPPAEWQTIGLSLLATLLRVVIGLLLALLWTLPLGILIGSNPRIAALLQPVVQIAASIPATALFPIFLIVLIGLPGGLNVAAVLLMLMGTQWYLLFNIIAGAAAIPQDLKYTTALLQIKGQDRWKHLLLPALFPYIITGLITASGGAWNASIIAEHLQFEGKIFDTVGIGALIARATSNGDYPLLLAATLSMIVTVVTINRLVWRRLYRLAEERYRME